MTANHHEFWDRLREDPREFRWAIYKLIWGLGPVDMDPGRGWRGDPDRETAEWFLENAEKVGRAALGIPLTDPDEAHKPYAVPGKVRFFGGNPPHDTYVMRRLIDRLHYGFTMASYNCQEGGMGTTYDEKDVAKRNQEIRLVIEDLAYALLGPELASTFVNFDASPLGDVSYQRPIPPCMENA